MMTSSGMPPPDPAPGGRSARAKIAAQQQAAARRAATRTRLMLAGGAIIVVVAVVVTFVIIKVNAPKPAPPTTASQGASGGSPGLAGAALQAVVAQVTGVPTATSDQVGKGGANAHPNAVGGAPALTLDGKPELVYIGAEFCPYCAAERWPMITALSRFGTFTGLVPIRSGSEDGAGNPEPYAATSTWTFVHATYTSKYLAFTPVEIYTNIPDQSTGGYTPLETMTAEQQALINKYDAAPYVPSADKGAIPFLYFGGKYLSVGASYDPGVLQGQTWAQIATGLHNPASATAKGVLGAANFITAALCELTGNQPATACTPTVRSLQSQL